MYIIIFGSIALTILLILIKQYMNELEEEKLDKEILEAENQLRLLLKEEQVENINGDILDKKLKLKELREKLNEVKEKYEIN